MTIEELYKFLGEFIKKQPKCKDKPIMVKKLGDKTTWEEVTFTSDTGVSSCPEYKLLEVKLLIVLISLTINLTSLFA